MTPAQLGALDAIRGHVLRTGVEPTYQKLAQLLDLSGKSAAWHLVDRLTQQGHLVKNGRRFALADVPCLSAVPSLALVAELRRRGELD